MRRKRGPLLFQAIERLDERYLTAEARLSTGVLNPRQEWWARSERSPQGGKEEGGGGDLLAESAIEKQSGFILEGVDLILKGT